MGKHRPVVPARVCERELKEAQERKGVFLKHAAQIVKIELVLLHMHQKIATPAGSIEVSRADSRHPRRVILRSFNDGLAELAHGLRCVGPAKRLAGLEMFSRQSAVETKRHKAAGLGQTANGTSTLEGVVQVMQHAGRLDDVKWPDTVAQFQQIGLCIGDAIGQAQLTGLALCIGQTGAAEIDGQGMFGLQHNCRKDRVTARAATRDENRWVLRQRSTGNFSLKSAGTGAPPSRIRMGLVLRLHSLGNSTQHQG